MQYWLSYLRKRILGKESQPLSKRSKQFLVKVESEERPTLCLEVLTKEVRRADGLKELVWQTQRLLQGPKPNTDLTHLRKWIIINWEGKSNNPIKIKYQVKPNRGEHQMNTLVAVSQPLRKIWRTREKGSPSEPSDRGRKEVEIEIDRHKDYISSVAEGSTMDEREEAQHHNGGDVPMEVSPPTILNC